MTESKIERLLEALFMHGAICGLLGIALVLALVLPGLRARGWLIAFTALQLTTALLVGMFIVVGVAGSQRAVEIFRYSSPMFSTGNGAALACLVLFIYGQRVAANDRLSPGDILFPFRGRIARRHFWVAELALSLGGSLPASHFFDRSLDESVLPKMLAYWLWVLLIIWPSLAVHVKRWHDRGKSGWMVVVNLIPIVGPIWAFIEVGCLPGTPGPNEYGDNPLAITPPQPSALAPSSLVAD